MASTSKKVPATPPPAPPRKFSTLPTPTTGRTQALKDLKLTIEYKHLKQNAPGGVLVTPAFDDLRRWHGVIFVRKGLYQGGVFKFTVNLPKLYNDHGVYPHVRFTSSLFNPFITPSGPPGEKGSIDGSGGGDYVGFGDGEETAEGDGGVLDLESAYPKWDPTTHFMVTVLTFVKKIFYLKDEDLAGYDNPADPVAKDLFLNDKEEFKKRASELASRSQEEVYSNPHESPLSFTAPAPAHDALRKSIVASEDGAVRSSTLMLELIRKSMSATGAHGDREEDSTLPGDSGGASVSPEGHSSLSAGASALNAGGVDM